MDPSTDLLQQLLQRPEEQWEQALAETCAAHPEHATAVRSKFESLRESGFVAAAAPAGGGRLGEFTLGRLLGQGGMGVVYEARQDGLDRTVALKVVRADLLYFPGSRERFRREIEAVARLAHPGIVTVFTVGDEHGLPYFAMELLRGASLEDVVRELAGHDPSRLTGADLAAVVARHANLPPETVARAPLFQGTWIDVCLAIGKLVADALEHAHARGVLHRDVKPSNVIVTPEGRAVLLDFGLAVAGGVDRITRDGSEVGSIPYMAPEQLRGEQADSRSDVYGLGVTLRELLALRHPFLANSRETTRQRVLAGDSLRLSELNVAVPWELRTVCGAATDVDPGRRYRSAALLAQDLANVRVHRPILARPSGGVRRLWRWSQRRPALATALGLGLLTAIGTPTAIALAIRSQRDRARAAELEEQHKSYEANVAAANSALQRNDAREARRRLEACPPELRGFEWHHLALALDGSLLALPGHAAAVTAVAISADAMLLASGGADGEVRLWDLRNGEVAQRFAHHRARITQLAFAADGSTLSIADDAQHASAVDVAARSLRAEWHPSGQHDRVFVGAGGRCVLVNFGGWRLALLNAATLVPEREVALEQVGQSPDSVLATDGRRLFSVGYGTRACMDLTCHDLDSGRRAWCVPMPREAGVRAGALSPDGGRLAVSDVEGRITVHATGDGTLQQVLADRAGAAGAVAETGAQLAFDRRGVLLAAAGADGGFRVFDVASGVVRLEQSGHEGAAHAVAVDGSGTLAATGGSDRTVRLWSPFGGRATQVLRGHSGAVRGLALVPAGGGTGAMARSELLVSVSEDASLRLWDTVTGMPRGMTGGHHHHANTLAVTADGTRAYSTFHGSVVTTAIPGLEQQPYWRAGDGPILDLELSPDGRTLLAATRGELQLLDPEGRRVLRALRGHDGNVLACAFGPGSTAAYSGGQDGRLLRWNLAADAPGADEPHVVLSAALPIRAIAVAADGRSLFLLQSAPRTQGAPRTDSVVARIGPDGTVLWERRCSSPPRSLVLLPDQARLATGHDDGTVAIWDAARGMSLLVRRLASAPIRALACDPAGNRLYVGAADEDRSCYAMWATRAIEPARMRELAFAAAAAHQHAAMRTRLRTSEEAVALIRAEPDPELRAFLETCERFAPVLTWPQLRMSFDLCLLPGLPLDQYADALRAAETVRQRSPDDALATGAAFFANIRLGNPERALACVEGISATGGWKDMEPHLRGGRALAYRQLGRLEAAAAEAEQLRKLAALETADAQVIALWREVEAALR